MPNTLDIIYSVPAGSQHPPSLIHYVERVGHGSPVCHASVFELMTMDAFSDRRPATVSVSLIVLISLHSLMYSIRQPAQRPAFGLIGIMWRNLKLQGTEFFFFL